MSGASKPAAFDVVFGRCSVALVTPFRCDADESVDLGALANLIRHTAPPLAASGAGALIVCGSTGEAHLLSFAEREAVFGAAVAAASRSAAPIVAGVGAFRTRDAVALALAAHKAGCSGIMLSLPPYIRPTDAELEAYVSAVAASTPLPVLLYNNAPRNGGGPSVASVARMHGRGEIQGVKIVPAQPGAGPMAALAAQLADATGPGLRVYTGSDVVFGELRTAADAAAGQRPSPLYGVTSILGNIVPAAVVALAGADAGAAARAHGALRPLADACLSAGLALPVGIKLALVAAGVLQAGAGAARVPLGIVPPGAAEAVAAAVARARAALAGVGP